VRGRVPVLGTARKGVRNRHNERLEVAAHERRGKRKSSIASRRFSRSLRRCQARVIYKYATSFYARDNERGNKNGDGRQ